MAFPQRSGTKNLSVANPERDFTEYLLSALEIFDGKISYTELMEIPISRLDLLIEAKLAELNKKNNANKHTYEGGNIKPGMGNIQFDMFDK